MANLYAAIYPSNQTAPTRNEVIAGTVPNAVHAVDTNAPTVTQAGYQLPAISGLAGGIGYRAAVVWENAGERSNMLISPAFNTPGAYTIPPIVMDSPSDIAIDTVIYEDAVYGISVTLYDAGGQPRTNLTDIVAVWWDTGLPSGEPVLANLGQTTNAAGEFVMNLTGHTGLPLGGTGYLLLYRHDEADYRDSLVFASQLTIQSL